MKRREFIAATAALIVSPRRSWAQGKRRRLGFLAIGDGSGQALNQAELGLLDGLRNHGWIDGRNLTIEYRFSQPADRLQASVADLIALSPDVLIAAAPQGTLALKSATATIPIVFVAVADPVGLGLVQSLSRPDGNITGLSTIVHEGFFGKRVEILRELVPSATKIALLVNRDNPIHRAILANEVPSTARNLGVALPTVEATTTEELDVAFASAAAQHADGIVDVGDPLTAEGLGERGRTPLRSRTERQQRALASSGSGRLRDMPRRTQGECGWCLDDAGGDFQETRKLILCCQPSQLSGPEHLIARLLSTTASRVGIKTKEEAMKRRDFLKSAGVAAATSTIAQPALAQSAPELRWRMAASWPKSLDSLYGACEQFAKYVAEATDNKFQVQVFAAGEIVPGLQVLDAVENGTVEMGNSASYYYWGKDAAFAFGTAVPFGLNTRQYSAWIIQGGGGKLLNELFAQYNCYGLMMGNTTAQMGGWFRKEIKTLDDLKGLKFRIGGFAGKVISKLGVIPQQLAPGDIYPALEKGTIDAVEWIGPYDDEKLGFVKVAKYYYSPGWWEGSANGYTFINQEKWQSLPKNYQAILTAAAYQAGDWLTTKYDYDNPPAIKRLVAAGAQMRLFSQEVMEAALKAANETYAEMSQSNARFKKLHDSMMAFRADSYQWWQVCELPFDTFQVRTRQKI